MRQLSSRISWLLIVTMILAMVGPVASADAAGISDLLSGAMPAAGAGTQLFPSSGNGFVDILLAIFLGKLLGNLSTSSGALSGTSGGNGSALTTSKEVIGFYAEWWGGDTASYSSFSKNLDTIRTIAPFWATLNDDGTLNNRGGSDHASVVQLAHKNNKTALLLVNNAKESKNGALPIHTLLRSQDLRSKSIDNLEAYIKQYNLDGVNIDFEMIPGEDKVYLSAFMRELYARFKPQGYIVSIDVFPKQNETNDVAAAYDYAELAKYADKIVIMTYDNHGAWSGPGPIADIQWVEKSIQYALQSIPNSKLYLGLAAYGYDWSGQKTESVEYDQIQLLMRQYNVKPSWDDASKSPYFSYMANGQLHQVWYENGESLKYKLDLVNKYNLAGAAIWRLGGEDPAYWQIIKDKLR